MTSEKTAASYARGIALAEEDGIGPLTLGAYLREVTSRYGSRDAAVLRQGDEAECWTYADLWERSAEVARALIASGVVNGTRVGVLMTNRLEFLSGVFGTALAGGVGTTISTFSTASELDEVLRASGCSVLLFERRFLKKDFGAMLGDLEPALAESEPGRLVSLAWPFLRHLVAIGDTGAADDDLRGIERWEHFLARGRDVSPDLVDAVSRAVNPSDPGTLFFSSGSTGKAKGHPQRTPRRVPADVALGAMV